MRAVWLLGVGVSGLADWIQEDLFADVGGAPADDATTDAGAADIAPAQDAEPARRPGWTPGADVEHDEHGPGWVWGSGLGRVTVRFETRTSGPGPVRTFGVEDPQLHRC